MLVASMLSTHGPQLDAIASTFMSSRPKRKTKVPRLHRGSAQAERWVFRDFLPPSARPSRHWRPREGEARTAPFVKLGTVLAGAVQPTSYRASLAAFDPYVVNGQRVYMETCWLPTLDSPSIDPFIQAMESAVSPGCAIFTHEFKGAASRVPDGATAFGHRRDHVLVEILATFADRADKLEEQRHHLVGSRHATGL
jgi:hypothetical protein